MHHCQKKMTTDTLNVNNMRLEVQIPLAYIIVSTLNFFY